MTTQIPLNPSQPAAPTPGYSEDKSTVGETQEVEVHELSLEEALALYDSAKEYVDKGFRETWDNAFKVYKRQRVKKHYEGLSEPVIPEAFTIIETLVANIAGGNPSFHFVKTNEEQSDDTSVLNGMLDYFMICNQMGLKNQEWVREALLYGTGTLHISWREGKPYIENIPLRDFFVDPNATNLLTARYAGHVFYLDRKKAEQMKVYDAKANATVDMYKNLEETKLGTSTGATNNGDKSKTDKEFKDMFTNSTLGEKAKEDQIFVIRIYDLYTGKLIEIGNRKQIIRYVDIPYQRKEVTRTVQVMVDGMPLETDQTLDEIKPFLPYAVLRDYVDTSQFYGEGEMAVILDRAEMLNDLESMDVDNLAVTGTPMFQIDPQFADLAAEIETIPGAVYPIPKGAIAPLPVAEIAADLDQKKDRVAAQMRQATAADEAVQGVSMDKGRVTATEVSSQLNQAQNRFSTKINNLEQEGYWQLGLAIHRMVQVFMTQEQVIRIVGPKGVVFKDYDPFEYNGEFEPHPELDTTRKRKQLEVGQKLNQMFEWMKGNAIYDQVEVGRFLMQHIDENLTDEKYNSLLAPPMMPPEKDPLEQITINYKDAAPDVKRQIEAKVGLQPSVVGNDMEANQHLADTLGNTINPTDIGPSAPPAPMPAAKPAGMAK